MKAYELVLCLLLVAPSCKGEVGSVVADARQPAVDAHVRDATADSGESEADSGEPEADSGRPDSAVTETCGDGRCNAGETMVTCAADCGPCRDLPGDLTPLESTLLNMQANTWYEHPDSKMREVCVPDSVGVRGVVGCAAVVAAWGGGAYDSARNQLILWGGGHADYHGNELYSFNVPQGTWSRLTEPSTGPREAITDQDPLPDGNPVSRHTYEGVEIISHADLLFSVGGSIANSGGGTNVTWAFDLEARTWRNLNPPEPGPGGYANASAYDPSSRAVIVRYTQGMSAYDLDTNTWTRLAGFGYVPLWPRYERGGDKTAVIDPVRGLFWSVGSGDVLVWDIAAAEIVTDDWATTGGGMYSNADVAGNYPEQLFEGGGGDIYDANAPGFDYDAAADALVAWPNEGGPYALNLETKVWTRGSATGAPTSRTSGGTFGRWRYIPDYNVFILVTSIDENVYFYKHRRCL